MGIEHGGVLQESKYTVVFLKLGFSPGGDMDSVAIFSLIWLLSHCETIQFIFVLKNPVPLLDLENPAT